MALTIALPLSGLEPEHFCSLGAKILYERGLRTLNVEGPISPSSTSESSSSGIGSLGPSSDNETYSSSPSSSRSESPMELIRISGGQQNLPVKVIYDGRDILNLGANIREPIWQMRYPMIPRTQYKMFMEDQSVFFRLGVNTLIQDYPTKKCQDCNFSEPVPFQL